MDSVATQYCLGVCFVGEDPVWTRVPLDGENSFSCGVGHPASTQGEPLEEWKDKSVAGGIPTGEVLFRQTKLPFKKEDRIAQLLPQEAADVFLHRLQAPRFAFCSQEVDDGAEVFYAVTEEDVLRSVLAKYRKHSFAPAYLVVSELGGWFFLSHLRLIPIDQKVLLLDFSAKPLVLCMVENSRLHACRVVSPGAVAAGDEAIRQEVSWLVAAMLKRDPECGQCLVLGEEQAYGYVNQVFSGNVTFLSLPEKENGLLGWKWVRSAGLALAARENKTDNLLNFRWGGLAVATEGMPWLAAWKPTAILACCLLGVIFLAQGYQYVNLKVKATSLQRGIREVFRQALPDAPAMIDPRLQMEQALRAASTGGGASQHGMVGLLGAVQLRLPERVAVQWLQLHFEDKEAEFLGEVGSYEDLDLLQTALREGGALKEVVIEDAQLHPKKKRVQFKLKVSGQ